MSADHREPRATYASHADGVRVRVPAKVNLHLGVGPLRADGFHDLCTVFHAVDLTDEVRARHAGALTLTITGEGAPDLATDERNLAWQAAQLLARATGREPHVALELHKAIPVAGGMAGGSADAAAALLACAHLWGIDIDTDLDRLAAQLGSDAVFPLHGGNAIGTGRGEHLTPAPAAVELHWVFALADYGVSAGDAYRELDRLRANGSAPQPLGPPDALLAALGAGDVHAVAAALGNDLQAATLSLAPQLAATLDAGTARGALAGLVSGSGPTCAFLCADAQAATDLAAELDGVCRAAHVARGPAAGARLS